jgi:large subunit ribosomal protein L15
MGKRKKSRKLRGNKTNDYGSKKKHRGAGNRGGRGLAGTGKRAGQKKSSVPKDYFGKKGFKIPRKAKKKSKAINISFLEKNLNKIGEKEGDFYLINLDNLGYTKLLSSGKITKKLKIICKSFSKKTEQKIKKAGGEIKCQS